MAREHTPLLAHAGWLSAGLPGCCASLALLPAKGFADARPATASLFVRQLSTTPRQTASLTQNRRLPTTPSQTAPLSRRSDIPRLPSPAEYGNRTRWKQRPLQSRDYDPTSETPPIRIRANGHTARDTNIVIIPRDVALRQPTASPHSPPTSGLGECPSRPS